MRSEIREKIRNARNEQINLANLNIIDEEMDDIAHEICLYQSNVKYIRFANNKIGNKGVSIICSKLATLQQLTQLDFQCNRIGEDGFLCLFQLKRRLPDLELALHGNQVTDDQCMNLLTNFLLN